MILSRKLSDLKGLRHGFFTREQEAAAGAARLGVSADNLLTARQAHTARALFVNAPWRTGKEEADALITDKPHLAIGILTADCVPVLLAEMEAGLIAAIHAGWRGAKAGIIEAALAQMKKHGARPENTVAAIGPAISQDNYEVSGAFRESFIKQDPWSADLFKPGAESHAFFDLKSYAAQRLERAGLPRRAIEILPHCVFDEEGLFCSRRRDIKDGGARHGRQISAIALAPAPC